MSPTLGQRLRQAREKMGLSLADIAHQTRIPVPRLKDMEDDNFNALGGMAYARSFVQTYARLLDVNAGPVLEQMQTPPLGGARDYRYLLENFGAWINGRNDFTAPPAKAMTPNRSAVATLSIAGLVLLIGMGVLLGQAWKNDRKTSAIDPARGKPALAKAEDTVTENTPDGSRALPVSDDAAPHPAIVPASSRAGSPRPMPAVSKTNGAPPKALPVEDDAPGKPKR